MDLDILRDSYIEANWDIYAEIAKDAKSALDKKIHAINYRVLKCVPIIPNEEGCKKFNRIYLTIKNQPSIIEIQRTPSGGISIAGARGLSDQYGIIHLERMLEFTIIIYFQNKVLGVRYQFGYPKLEKSFSGRRALNHAKKDCERFGIDLNTLAIKNGLEVKKEIEKPKIWLDEDFRDMTLSNCHHIDRHSSHPAGMVKYFPELKPLLEFYYQKRHKSKIAKAQLVMLWGAFQSKSLCGAKWAHIAKAGIHDTNQFVDEMIKRLRKSGRQVIAINTDGIWYQGDIYHGEGEGDNMGDWHNDHTNCTLRFKSAGSYEYIENGKYTPVVRGRTTLDKLKDRDHWEWGDIYRGASVMYEFDKETGLKQVIGAVDDWTGEDIG